MERFTTEPRPDWQATVEAQGLMFHTGDEGSPYWDETVHYRFTAAEVDVIQLATAELDRLCLAAVDHVIERGLWDAFGVPAALVPWVRQSWETQELTVVGRFDLAYDGSGPPKLLEYNADTPTSLLEAAVIQWQWQRDRFPDADQFNSIHERLIDAWKRVKLTGGVGSRVVHFAAVADHVEDYVTVNYLRDTAMQAEIETDYLNVDDVGWNEGRRTFVDRRERAITHAFKLYPWEWMFAEAFGPHLPAAPTRWFEPPWKVILSNKALLAVLWELFPGHPNLVPASLSPIEGDVVRKPRQSREGSNVAIFRGGSAWFETPGEYGDGPHVWQRYVPIRKFGDRTPVIGSWMVNGHACGMGIREDATPVTGNLSRFVPHYFAG